MDQHQLRNGSGVSIVYEEQCYGGGAAGNNRLELYQKCNRGSHSSDTSSAYSGSDTMMSVNSSSLDVDEVDLSGLVESVVDSDEEDLAESMDSLAVRDTVRECLEKDPSDRTQDDIETLLEFTKNLKAFTNMTLAVRRALCSVMVFAVVEKAGTMVMNNGEELDSWSVLINGQVEIEHTNSEREILQVGDSFGILPTMIKLYHRGVMRTKCHDCQFLCITQTDYYRIHHQGEVNTQKHTEDGQLVMVTELRYGTVEDGGRRGHVVIRGTAERLMLHLIEENSLIDPTYVEDFLLTHRAFISNAPQQVLCQLLKWFENESAHPLKTTATSIEIRDRVTRVILLWVNNHFTDFETNPQMMEYLEVFESGLEKKSMLGHLRLLHIACAAKARQRVITLARSSRDEKLNFQIIGGYEKNGVGGGNFGIFIAKVEKKSKPEDKGLKRGDQILEVNGQSFEHVSNARAMELLTSTTHLSITVKSNLLVFKEMLSSLMAAAAADNNTTNTNSSSSSPKLRQQFMHQHLSKLHISSTNGSTIINSNSSSRLPLTSSATINNQNDSTVFGRASTPPPLPPPPQKRNDSMYVSKLSLPTSYQSKQQTNSIGGGISSSSSSCSSSNSSSTSSFMTLGPKKCLQKALTKINRIPKSAVTMIMDGLTQQQPQQQQVPVNDEVQTTSTISTISSQSSNSVNNYSPLQQQSSLIKPSSSNTASTNSINISGYISSSDSALYPSQSSPDLTEATTFNPIPPPSATTSVQSCTANSTNHFYEDLRCTDYPEHVLKVYKPDQTCKYLLIHKETTAHEVVMLALQEFGIHQTSSNFSLCEVSVGEGGMIKQRRLHDQLQNLAERIGLASRYYLKTNGITETLVPDDMAPELIRDSAVHFLQLNANELTIQLTFQDFAIFRQIESTEFVDDLFELKSRYGVPMLRQFSELVNKEMFWVVSEVCGEANLVRRMKIIKQFIKIARHCKECKNFNSMFAIISGLGHAAVSRLRLTWEKLPSKYQKLFCDLQELMDPSRNMSKYRQLVQTELSAQNPIIPFYPVVKKDLTFIHLGNDTYVELLINFEKLRMIAKEVRSLTRMCCSPYNLSTILELNGQPPSSAMVALNQMNTTITGSSGVSSVSNSGSGNGMHCSVGSNSMPHNLQTPQGGQATVKRRKKSTAAPNSKKMFEEAQMVRRVKAYLNNLKILTDEDQLHQLSIECEASSSSSNVNIITGTGGMTQTSNSITNNINNNNNNHRHHQTGAASGTIIIRKRHPSPTLSTTSSTSSASEGIKGTTIITSVGTASSSSASKFGTASPQAVKKILSLSEQNKTRPHQPRYPGGFSMNNSNSSNSAIGSGCSGSTNGGACSNAGNNSGIVGTGINCIGLSHQYPSHHHHHHHHHHHGLHHLLTHHSSSISPLQSPGVHRRIGSSCSAGTVSYSIQDFPIINSRSVHERSHSDTPTPPISVNLSVESSSVTSLTNLPLRKNMTSGSITSSDSGHGSCMQSNVHCNCLENADISIGNSGNSGGGGGGGGGVNSNSGGSGIYHVASSILHNSPSPTLHQERRHSVINGSSKTSNSNHVTGSGGGSSNGGNSATSIGVCGSSGNGGIKPNVTGNNSMKMSPQQPTKSTQHRHPLPAYSVAAQLARKHRFGRAHSHEGVTSASSFETFYIDAEQEKLNDDEDEAQVSAV